MATQPPPASTANDTDIDPETIQSTVDMSLSLALGLVQSWMPLSSSASVDASVIQSRKKVEESMRRPPRLGVGAPMPSAQHTQPTHHETQRLKNRLVGSGAARRKDEETRLNGASSSRGRNDASDDDDEGDSRASAMRKKSKGVNGLSVFGGGKKAASATAKPESQPQSGTGTLASARPLPVPGPASDVPPARPSPPAILESGSHSTSSTQEPIPSDEPRSPSPTRPLVEEPMGINKLPPKLALAAKIWPNGSMSPVSDASSKRRRTGMMPPPSPAILPPPAAVPTSPIIDSSWSLELPRLSPSRSASVTSSSVPSSSAAEPHLDSTARLSRKERKRLRKAQMERVGDESVQTSEFSETSARRIDGPESDESESETGSQIGETEKVVTQNDTVQDGGKKKRKRRARRKSGPGPGPGEA